jgi:NAD(P)-dependent dehydrogenase (short-subunit alcohol dehydrogenase family)
MRETQNPFDLTGRVAVITGGAGLLGEQHARAICAAGGIPVLVDIQQQRASEKAAALSQEFGVAAVGYAVDITKQEKLETLRDEIVARFGRLDILINNAANNPKMEASAEVNFSRLENFPLAQWEADIAVGLTGAFLCSKVFGSYMASHGG